MQNELASGIYCIENIINHKKYIGQVVNIKDRKSKHYSALRHNRHQNKHLQNSWNKYGEKCFDFYILECCEKERLDELEIYYIDFYHAMDGNLGYNKKSGGQHHNYLSDEVKTKISEGSKRAYLDPNLKKLRSEDALNQWTNPEIKEKIMGSNNGMYGKHHTEESKQKMSEKKKGTPSWRRNTTPVFNVELNREFKDSTEAGKELSLDGSGILKVCQGKRQTCGGYHWKFLLLENKIS